MYNVEGPAISRQHSETHQIAIMPRCGSTHATAAAAASSYMSAFPSTGHCQRATVAFSRLPLRFLLLLLLPSIAASLQPPSFWSTKASATSANAAVTAPVAPEAFATARTSPTLDTPTAASALNAAPATASRMRRKQSGGSSSSVPRVRLAQRAGASARMGAPSGWAATRRSGARRASTTTCSLLGGLKDSSGDRPEASSFSVGQEVVVSQDVNFMHVPGHKSGFNAKGSVGTVLRIYTEPNLSCTREVKVQFTEPKKWVGHFEPWEIEPN